MSTQSLRLYDRKPPAEWRRTNDRILSAVNSVTWEMLSDDDGRPTLTFILVGTAKRNIDAIAARLEGISACRKAVAQ